MFHGQDEQLAGARHTYIASEVQNHQRRRISYSAGQENHRSGHAWNIAGHDRLHEFWNRHQRLMNVGSSRLSRLGAKIHMTPYTAARKKQRQNRIRQLPPLPKLARKKVPSTCHPVAYQQRHKQPISSIPHISRPAMNINAVVINIVSFDTAMP